MYYDYIKLMKNKINFPVCECELTGYQLVFIKEKGDPTDVKNLQYKISKNLTEIQDEIIELLEIADSIFKGKYIIGGYISAFELEEDLVLFKLTWG